MNTHRSKSLESFSHASPPPGAAVTAYDLRGPGGARAVLYVDPYARFGDKTLAGWSVLTVRGPNPGDPPAVVLVGPDAPRRAPLRVL